MLEVAKQGRSGYFSDLDFYRAVARDKERDIEDCLASFEDLMDCEVGDTSLVRARNIERESGGTATIMSRCSGHNVFNFI